jgi:hypothetical protein
MPGGLRDVDAAEHAFRVAADRSVGPIKIVIDIPPGDSREMRS